MEDVITVSVIFGCLAAVALGFSPIGRAIAERIRAKHALPDLEDLRAELAETREAHGSEVGQVRQELADLAERLDFAERMLAKQREGERGERLGPPKG